MVAVSREAAEELCWLDVEGAAGSEERLGGTAHWKEAQKPKAAQGHTLCTAPQPDPLLPLSAMWRCWRRVIPRFAEREASYFIWFTCLNSLSLHFWSPISIRSILLSADYLDFYHRHVELGPNALLSDMLLSTDPIRTQGVLLPTLLSNADMSRLPGP